MAFPAGLDEITASDQGCVGCWDCVALVGISGDSRLAKSVSTVPISEIFLQVKRLSTGRVQTLREHIYKSDSVLGVQKCVCE